MSFGSQGYKNIISTFSEVLWNVSFHGLWSCSGLTVLAKDLLEKKEFPPHVLIHCDSLQF